MRNRHRVAVWTAVVTATTLGVTLTAAGTVDKSTAPTATSAAAILDTTPTRTPSPTPTPPPPRRKSLPLKVTSATPTNSAAVYGVGLPIYINFNRDVPAKARDDVQNAITVTATKPLGPAAWGWLDANTIVFRPRTFWPANTTITATVNLAKVKVPINAKDLIGKGRTTVRLKTGDALITKVNGKSQTATVYRNGKKVRTVKVSTGKAGWRTRTGIKIIHEKVRNKVFTNTAIGEYNETYRLVSSYALRLTYSGEFLHAAPWATSRLGRFAGSHGCTNVSDTDAKWYYNQAKFGDPVITTGTGGTRAQPGNGLGGVLNVPWKAWLKTSAIPLPPQGSPVTTPS
jgi:lipoprotein-anchoring transpeptidase ErfK/SrfK